ncbi:GNAT family N-acetyltransferase [Bacillus sp. B15-48]|uniref:GNAT family N-acetyltransferase n=1 Tax=Bacillus sp. B15-48 TaxID=1548601 RepID=UPI00193F3EC3|nr:GNAT family N-acetyltransferase [Bacillus sp. B15-48]MBM4763293.1 GNAT family N-acetyltransferase [Bacillus sp. B15-48]
MLIRYNKQYEKIAMGLLSFNPNEKNLQNLLKTINEYVSDQNSQLFLWKEEEGVIGVVGIKFEDHEFKLQHLSVNPSHRDKGYGKLIVKALQEIYPNKKLTANEITASFIEKCELNQQMNKNKNETISV